MTPQRSNPLEQLRVCSDPQQRARLLCALDGGWSAAFQTYEPSPAEAYLAKELAQWPYNVMLTAVQHPGTLAHANVESQARIIAMDLVSWQ
jgi:hypothetical protein